MRFTDRTRQAEFIKRYKRFFADVRLDGQVIVAHVPNTGSMKACLFPGAPCVVTESDNPARKLKATLQMIQTPTSWVGVNTALPNALAQEAWENGLIEDWRPFKALRREYKISKDTRIDLVLAPNSAALENKENLYFIEIKNVSYAEGTTALFPDAVTARGQKHLEELMELKRQGFGAEILFVVQRQDCQQFAPADLVDPEYGRRLRQARELGVRVRVLTTEISPLEEVKLSPVELPLSF